MAIHAWCCMFFLWLYGFTLAIASQSTASIFSSSLHLYINWNTFKQLSVKEKIPKCILIECQKLNIIFFLMMTHYAVCISFRACYKLRLCIVARLLQVSGPNRHNISWCWDWLGGLLWTQPLDSFSFAGNKM